MVIQGFEGQVLEARNRLDEIVGVAVKDLVGPLLSVIGLRHGNR